MLDRFAGSHMIAVQVLAARSGTMRRLRTKEFKRPTAAKSTMTRSQAGNIGRLIIRVRDNRVAKATSVQGVHFVLPTSIEKVVYGDDSWQGEGRQPVHRGMTAGSHRATGQSANPAS